LLYTLEPNADSVEIKGTVTALNVNINYKQQPELWEFPQKDPAPKARSLRPKVELDTENVRVTFMIASPNVGEFDTSTLSHNTITIKRDDIKRLNLTVGDTLVLRVNKE
jgi:hypothetical protein